MIDAVAIAAFLLAAGPALLYWRNVRQFRPPPSRGTGFQPVITGDRLDARPTLGTQISVLIPARNEETSIADCVESVLSSQDVVFEVIVLDDHSEDRTAAIVRELAAKDSRVRLESAPPLPAGWNGKQHACHVLAGQARFPVITFLDADVRLEPDALVRMNLFREGSGAALVSGFPRQETRTFLEKLLIPLMHFLLLGFLPLHRMRASTNPGYGAGCGQWFLTTADAYVKAGGHAAIRASRHDGLMLPRAYRRAGLMTDLCDVTDLARCRMYHSASEVWCGLAKNANEGLGSPCLILFTTLLLFGGQVLPWLLVPLNSLSLGSAEILISISTPTAVGMLGAMAVSYFVRLDSARRFRQSWIGALLHPIGITLLIVIQWYAMFRSLRGKPIRWRGR